MDTPDNNQEQSNGNPSESVPQYVAPATSNGVSESSGRFSSFIKEMLCEPTPLLDNAEDRCRDKWYILPCILGIIGMITGFVFFYFANDLLMFEEGELPILQIIIGIMPYQFFTFGACLLGMIPIIIRDGFRKSFDILSPMPPWKTFFFSVLKLLVLMYPLVYIVNKIAGFIFDVLSIPMPEQLISTLGKEASLSFWVFSAISALITAPITEEVIFRLVLNRAIRAIMPIWATLLSSIAFAMMHSNTYHYWPSLFVIALFMIRARRVYGLPCSILLHSSYNFIAFTFIVIDTILE